MFMLNLCPPESQAPKPAMGRLSGSQRHLRIKSLQPGLLDA
jgi:hypothetical protein